MKALSLKNPWPSFILDYVGKPTWKGIENRRRLVFGPKFFDQVILIHTSAGKMTRDDLLLAQSYALKAGMKGPDFPTLNSMEFGGIVGQMVVVDVIPPDGNHPKSNDPWWMAGQFGYILDPARTKRLPFIPCKGSQGLWNVPPEVEALL